MVIAVLDASAFLRFLDSEPGAEYVGHLIERAHDREIQIKMSAINWGEIVYTSIKAKGVSFAVDLAAKLQTLPLIIEACGATTAMEAALFKEKFKVPYADAFAGSLALREAAVLVTADFDFKNIPPEILKIEFLPIKKRARN